jgi:putative oxidoreductase
MTVQELETVWAPRVLSIVRIVAALIFMEHGTQKVFGFPPSPNPGPALFSLYWIRRNARRSSAARCWCSGLFTRPVAFILSGEMAFAYWMSHAPRSCLPAAQWRRRVDPVLLPVPLSRLRGRRCMEP